MNNFFKKNIFRFYTNAFFKMKNNIKNTNLLYLHISELINLIQHA